MTALQAYGYDGMIPEGFLPARITEQHREQYTVITERGDLAARLKGSFMRGAIVRADMPCVGDFVLLQYNDSGPSMITELLPRRTKFSRADFSGHLAGYAKHIKEQVVAANFDYVFILTSLNRDFNIHRILRYLTQARQSGGQPVVILTKADLVDDFTSQINEVKTAAPDVPVHAISSRAGYGLDALAGYLQPGKTIVFLGMSGVGKSSLLNTLADEEVMTVKETRKEDASKGQHTTTHRQLFTLPQGAMVIDTPGMRELGLLDAEEGISIGFGDVEGLFAQCRFSDCRHTNEPGCAIRAALESGTLTPVRWEQYQKQQRENKYTDDRSAYHREDAAHWKKHQIHVRQHMKANMRKK
ncbi:MAG: ribosome small subunit-dependent GTPase A [Defluviitaleaceae bacterium]|nr:ribosome small subunit-dependent GTPase A [Defluviitaleaceae bacterium]